MIKWRRLASTNSWYTKIQGFIIFKSYDTIIVIYDSLTGKILKNDNWYSVSTTRQKNRFYNEVLGIDRKNHEKYLNIELASPQEVNNVYQKILNLGE